jgi:Concanavalin A-like lectin/glucanases superfamily
MKLKTAAASLAILIPSTNAYSQVSSAGLEVHYTYEASTVVSNTVNDQWTIDGSDNVARTGLATFTSGAKFGDALDVSTLAKTPRTASAVSTLINSNYMPGTGDYTLTFWYRQTPSTGTQNRIFNAGARASDANNDDGFQIYKLSANTIEVAFHDPALGTTTRDMFVSSGTGIFDGATWNHIALVRSGTSLRLWLNGVDVGGTTLAVGYNIAVNTNTSNREPCFGPDTNITNAAYDDAAIFRRALSSTEIAAIWNGGTGATISSLLVSDSDADGLPDTWEQQIVTASGYALTLGDIKGPLNSPATSDYDNDSSSDSQEYARTTSPIDPDSDDDLLTDGVETKTGVFVSATNTGSDPLDNDSDNDFLADNIETGTGTYVGTTDTGTDPNQSDTDNDGACDRLEVFAAKNPFLNTSLPSSGNTALVGSDDFSYEDGNVANRNGGTGFDFDNSLLNDSFTGHTTRVSDWDIVSGSGTVAGGKLLTLAGSAKREFNGFVEGSNVINNDEYIGAFNEANQVKTIYVRADVTRSSGTEWSGISLYDFNAERLFVGIPNGIGPSGTREFGIQVSGVGNTFRISAPIIPEVGRTYTIVGKLDYANDLVTLWVDPDLTKTEAENTPYVTTAYTGTSWTTAMRLGSGGSTAAAWDHAVAARQWSAVGTFPGVLTFANWIGGFPSAAALPGFIDDADGDGIDNGIEHILGSDPSMPSQGLRDVSTGTGTFVFRHSRTNALAVDVSPGYQWSTDMLTWYASGTTNPGGTLVDLTTVTVTDTAAPLNDEIEVTATVTGSAPTLFVRLTSQR